MKKPIKSIFISVALVILLVGITALSFYALKESRIGWKAYEIEEWGLTFRYPDGYAIEEQLDSDLYAVVIDVDNYEFIKDYGRHRFIRISNEPRDFSGMSSQRSELEDIMIDGELYQFTSFYPDDDESSADRSSQTYEYIELPSGLYVTIHTKFSTTGRDSVPLPDEYIDDARSILESIEPI